MESLVNQEVADRFGAVAERFCHIVDTEQRCGRNRFLLEIYRLLPGLIDEALKLPDVSPSESAEAASSKMEQKSCSGARLSHDAWKQIYDAVAKTLGDWECYWQTFDTTKEQDAPVAGSLADDIADIYRDINEGITRNRTHQFPPEDIIWEWRFSFYTHWEKHAIDALQAIHCRAPEILA